MIKNTGIGILAMFGVLILLSINVRYTCAQTAVKQGNPVPQNFCIDAREMNLYLMINDYRQRYNLPPVPLSKSLSYVAALHAKDLFLNHPDQGACNFHSWSNKGFWVPFCYPKDENKKNSVWDKPRELTKYPSRAYEIVYWENNPLLTDTVMMVWKMEDYFNSFLLNTGKWQGKPWNAIGIAVYENYACAWFGEVSDPEGAATVCGSVPTASKDTVKQAVQTEVLSQPKDSIPVTYCIIVNSLLTKDAANKLVSTLKSKGYPDAKVLEKNGKFQVSISESQDKAAIMLKLKELKKMYRGAWLLKRDKVTR